MAAVETLTGGGLVAFPTETVYGLGADACNPDAVALLYKVKNRPANHPSIVHLANFEQVDEWCREVPPVAELLAGLFWPGPLTMIFQRSKKVLDAVTGGQDTVAIRIPSHPLAHALLTRFNGGVVAPSANRFGHLSPTSAADVKAEFGDEILVLDGGACQVGIESTIIDLSCGSARILRPGMILEASIQVALSEVGVEMPAPDTLVSPRVPGSLPSHYAPDRPVRLAEPGALNEVLAEMFDKGLKPAVISFNQPTGADLWQVMSKSPNLYAFSLYRTLRRFDTEGVDVIVVETPPSTPEWTAILDRLTRAAGLRKEEVDDGT